MRVMHFLGRVRTRQRGGGQLSKEGSFAK